MGLQHIWLHSQWSQRLPTRLIQAPLSRHQMFEIHGGTLMQSWLGVNAFLNIILQLLRIFRIFLLSKGLLVGDCRRSSLVGVLEWCQAWVGVMGSTGCALPGKSLPGCWLRFACSL